MSDGMNHAGTAAGDAAMSRVASRAGAAAARGGQARTRRASRTQGTFMVEAMLLLTCVLVLLAVTVSLFAFAAEASSGAQRMQEAADIAQNAVEEFVADPAGIPEEQVIGDYVVMCDVGSAPMEAGVMYDARVTVVRGADELCALAASRYVPSGGEAGRE